MKYQVIGTISALALATAATLASTAAMAQDDSLERLKAAGQVRVAVGSAPPLIGISPSGEPAGYAIEVMNAVLAGLELPKLTAIKADWSAMIPGMQANQYDFVAPGLTITEERCDAIIFSGPVWSMQFGIFVPAGNPNGVTDVRSIGARPDGKLAVVTGSSQDFYAVEKGLADAQLVRVTDVQAGVAAVRGGRAEAFLVGQFSVHEPEEKGLTVVVESESPVFGYGVALRKEDVALRDAIDLQLDKMRESGELQELYSVKFGIPNWDEYIKKTRASDFYPNCT